MKLNKEEIAFIDNYLIKNDVKFWDVRMELLDHIILSVETKIENEGVSFQKALLETHEGFGNKLGHFKSPSFEQMLFYSNKGFKKFTLQKQKEVSRKYKKQYLQTFISFIVSKKFLLEYAFILALVLIVFQHNQNTALVLTVCIAHLPVIVKIIYLVYEKSNRKSLSVQMSMVGSILFMSNNNFIILGFNFYFNEATQKPYIILIVFYLMIFPFLRHALNTFIKIFKTSKYWYNLLLS